MDNPEALLPGQDLVEQGLADLARNDLSESALLILMAAPRLRGIGLTVPEIPSAEPWSHVLYGRLEARLGAGAHSYYNALVRRIVSYAHAREREMSQGIAS